MVEVKITYETLFDLLRKEKSRNELQDIEQTFFSDVVSYLKDKKNSLNATGISTSRAEQEKIKIQLKNIKRILKELYDLRERKVLNLAVNKVKTGSNLIDTSKMLQSEKEFFEESIVLLRKYHEKILGKVLAMENPFIGYQEPKAEEPSEEEPEQEPEEKNDSVKVKLLTDLPKFMGLDKKIYGPYEKDKVEELPGNIAELLVKKGRAEKAA